MHKDIIYRLNEYNQTECHFLFRTLLEDMIKRLRRENDNATYENVLRNQGAIREISIVLRNLIPIERTHDDEYKDIEIAVL